MSASPLHARLRAVGACRPAPDAVRAPESTGAEAALVAESRAGLEGSAADCLIAASTSHRDHRHSLARLIADRLPYPPRAALDLNAACAGFCYSLEMGRSLIAGGTFRRVLVVAAERLPGGPAGAGAALLDAGPEPGVGPVAWGSDPVGREADGAAAPAGASGPAAHAPGTGTIARAALDAVRRAGIGTADLAAVVPHPCDDRAVTALAAALALPSGIVVARDTTHRGAAAAASIPLAVDRLLQRRPQLHGSLALLTGYGAGTVYAAQVVCLPPVPVTGRRTPVAERGLGVAPAPAAAPATGARR